MNDVDRQKANSRAHWRNFAALGWLLVLPGVAQAQYSPGDLVTTPLPALNSGIPFAGGGQPGAATANPPDFQWGAFAELSGRYTTNALGSSTSSSADFDSRAMLGLTASETSVRVNANLNYTGSVDYFANHASSTIFTNRLDGNALVSVVQDHLLLSANVFAAPVYSSQLGNIAPSGETLPAGANSDLRNTYGFSASPDLTFRLGDFLRSDSVPSYSAVYIDQPTGAGAGLLPGIASDITTKAFTQRIVSGDDFTRLQWSAVANYSEMGHSSGGLIQRSATGELAYAITHDISVVADGGYQTVKANVPLNKVLSGPVLLAGLKFDTARLTGEFRVGEQYRSLTTTGHLAYQIAPTLTLSASASDDVSTPGASLLNPTSLLAGIISGIALGQIQIPASGVLSLNDVSLSGIGLQNTPSRLKSQTVSLQYSLDRLTAGISGYSTTQDTLAGALPRESLHLRQIGITPSLSYTFSPDLTGGVGFSYSDQTLAFGHSTLAEFDIHSDYTISDQTQVFAEGSYLLRNSNAALSSVSSNSGSVSIASIRVGIRRQF